MANAIIKSASAFPSIPGHQARVMTAGHVDIDDRFWPPGTVFYPSSMGRDNTVNADVQVVTIRGERVHFTTGSVVTKTDEVRALFASGLTPRVIRKRTGYDRRFIEVALRPCSGKRPGRPPSRRCPHCGELLHVTTDAA